ncbi:hypothetical protein Tco_0668443 [Tanacetum coccineum]
MMGGWSMRQSDGLYHDHFGVFEFVLEQEDTCLDQQLVNAIVEIGIEQGQEKIQIQDQGPTSGIRANRGTLNKKNHKITNKHSPTILYKMSQPANDEFSQHLSDDEESNHEDASDTGAAPKQQQQVIPQITAISAKPARTSFSGILVEEVEGVDDEASNHEDASLVLHLNNNNR